jgi:hypothetical protein
MVKHRYIRHKENAILRVDSRPTKVQITSRLRKVKTDRDILYKGM